MSWLLRSFVVSTSILTVVACASNRADDDDPAATVAGVSVVNYHRDVRPIVEKKCLGCHVPGGIAPFALDSYAALRAMGGAVKAAVVAKEMPPWPPGSGCSDYIGDRSLEETQIATIKQWVDSGRAEGDPADFHPLAPTPSVLLSRVDRHIPSGPYTPVTTRPDDYHCFLLDWNETTAKYVTGFRANPGNKSIVHHVAAYLAPPETVADFVHVNEAHGGRGWTCYGGPGDSDVSGELAFAAMLGGWAPGTLVEEYPSGTGIKVPVGSKVVLQVHYNTNQPEGALSDATSLDFELADHVEHEGALVPFLNVAWVATDKMTIPPRSKDLGFSYSADFTTNIDEFSGGALTPNQPVKLWASQIHMHTHGTHGGLEVRHADGTRDCLVDIPEWNFHWQGLYRHTTPKTFVPGDSLSLNCHFANTGSTSVKFGEGTEDEMCVGVVYVTQ